MPWSVVKRGAEWCVVKSADGKTVACHDSQESAEAQRRALYANEGDMSADTLTAAETTMNFLVDDPSAWEGILGIEGVEGGSGRQFAHNSLIFDSTVDGRMPLDWQKVYSHGGTNDETVRVGTVHLIWRDGPVQLEGFDEPVMLIRGEGNFDLGGPPDDDAHEAFRRADKGTLNGMSMVVDKIKDADVEAVYPVAAAPTTESLAEGDVVSMIFGKPEKEIYHRGRVRGVALVEYPEFTESRVTLKSKNRAVTGAPEPRRSPTGAYALGDEHFATVSDGPWNAPVQIRRLAGDLRLTTAVRAFATIGHFESGQVARDQCALLHHEIDDNGVPGAANVTAITAALRALSVFKLPAERAEAARAHLLRHLEAAGMAPPIDAPATQPLTAAAHVITIPDLPPASWFTEPVDVDQHGALTVTDQGRVYGWLAPSNVAHRSFQDRSVYAPRNVDYTRFLGGETIVAGGSRVITGPITMECGHANPHDSRRADLNWAPDHYHNTCSVVASVTIGESARGTWVAGALVAGVTPEQITRMMTCRLSGDWQPVRDQPGRRELVAALLVPVPGFPLARSAPSVRVDNGELVAASVPVRVVRHDEDVDVDQAHRDAERAAYQAVVASMQRRIGRTPADKIAALALRVHGGTATLDAETFHKGHADQDSHGNWARKVGDAVDRTLAGLGDVMFQQPKEDFEYPHTGELPAPGRFDNEPFPTAERHKELISDVVDRFDLSARQKLRLRQSDWSRDITRAASQGEWDYVKKLLKKSGVARNIEED